jgi:hypothetical protein
MGDLNNIMHPNLKYGLMDLGYSGPAYTWTNKHFTTNPNFERLDRCLGDDEWCQAYPSTIVYHLPMLYSDHAPILAIMTLNCPKPKRRFNFQNCWLLKMTSMRRLCEHGPKQMVSLSTCVQEN